METIYENKIAALYFVKFRLDGSDCFIVGFPGGSKDFNNYDVAFQFLSALKSAFERGVQCGTKNI